MTTTLAAASSKQMVKALMQVRHMIHGASYEQIDAIVAEHGLDYLISDAFIDFARRMKEPSCVIFLSTLAVHNATNTVRAQMILQTYQSIASGRLTDGIAKLPHRHVVRQVIVCLANKSALPATRSSAEKRKGTGQEWVLAFELCLDHDALAIALTIFNEETQRPASAEYVLLCARALVERAKGIGIGELATWQAWIAVQTAVYHKLLKLKYRDLAVEIAQLIAGFCHNAGMQDEAIRWYETVPAHADGALLAQYQMSNAYGNLQKFDIALGYLDATLTQLCGRSNDWINAHFLHADANGEKVGKTTFNDTAAATALTDLQKILAQSNVVPFLVSGTLLGYVRNGGFLSHDKDIDIGIFESQNIFDTLACIAESQLFEVKFDYLRIEKTYQVPVIHRATGMAIDIFIYYPAGDRLITGVHGSFGYIQNFTFKPFALEKISFLGVEFAIPQDHRTNLEENFGNWQVPDSCFISHLECPTTVDVGGTVYLVVARLEMLRSLVEGKSKKVDRIANILRRWQDVPNAMQPELIDRLQARFGTQAKLARQPDATVEAPAYA